MSNWTPRTTYSGIEYGGTASQYYWSTTYNHYAYPSICLANCTCYAEGRQAEGGLTSAVDFTWAQSDLGGLPSAWQFHWYPNTAAGWVSANFAGNNSKLKPGDLVIWSDNTNGQTRNHVAVIEVVYSSRRWLISESLYTEGNGIRATANFNSISNWMLNNVPARFFTSRVLDLDNPSPSWYGDQWPDYVLYLNNSVGAFKFFTSKNKMKRRRIIYV